MVNRLMLSNAYVSEYVAVPTADTLARRPILWFAALLPQVHVVIRSGSVRVVGLPSASKAPKLKFCPLASE